MTNLENAASSFKFFRGVGSFEYSGSWCAGVGFRGNCLLLVTRATIHFSRGRGEEVFLPGNIVYKSATKR